MRERVSDFYFKKKRYLRFTTAPSKSTFSEVSQVSANTSFLLLLREKDICILQLQLVSLRHHQVRNFYFNEVSQFLKIRVSGYIQTERNFYFDKLVKFLWLLLRVSSFFIDKKKISTFYNCSKKSSTSTSIASLLHRHKETTTSAKLIKSLE